MKKMAAPLPIPLLPSLVTFLAASLLSSPCRAGETARSSFREATRPERTLKVALARDVSTWDPARIDDPLTHEVMSAIYETLYRQDPFSSEPVLQPLLAQDYPKFSKDGRTATIRIRSDVKFQDHACFAASQGRGREVGAEDFVRALKRLALPGINHTVVGLPSVRLAGFEALRRKLAATPKAELDRVLEKTRFEGAHAQDAHTLVLKLAAPWPRLSGFLSFLATAPFPNEWTDCAQANSSEPWVDRIAIGTGPFRVARWVRGQKIELERNPDFHPEFTPVPATGDNSALAGRILPLVSRLEFEILPNPRERFERLRSGELDRIPYTPELRADVLDAEGKLKPELRARGFELLPQGVPRFHALLFGHLQAPLSDHPALRRAIAEAVDRTEWSGPIRRAFPEAPDFQGAATLESGGFISLTEKFKFAAPNLDRARTLLKEAGYAMPDQIPALTLDLGGTDPTTLAMGDAIRASLEKIGLRVKVRAAISPDFLPRLQAGDFQMALASFSLDAQGPEYLFQLLHGAQSNPGPNDSRFRDVEFDRTYAALLAEKSGEARRRLAARLAQLASEKAAWVPGFAFAEFFLVRTGSIGFRPAHFLNLHWKYWSGR